MEQSDLREGRFGIKFMGKIRLHGEAGQQQRPVMTRGRFQNRTPQLPSIRGHDRPPPTLTGSGPFLEEQIHCLHLLTQAQALSTPLATPACGP